PTEARTHACPECGSGSTIQIIYGVPDELLRFAAEEGYVILGGWLFADDATTSPGCRSSTPW
ncbi:hypothetical protein ACC691_38950, partial [Rhizobium johnstonii]|uniref:hypothetical protein n=1 Tax=Rhizobium johnstonii TaxID=3019933 RepID=UPI003F97F408